MTARVSAPCGAIRLRRGDVREHRRHACRAAPLAVSHLIRHLLHLCPATHSVLLRAFMLLIVTPKAFCFLFFVISHSYFPSSHCFFFFFLKNPPPPKSSPFPLPAPFPI